MSDQEDMSTMNLASSEDNKASFRDKKATNTSSLVSMKKK